MNVPHIEASQVIPSLEEPAEEKKVYGNSQCMKFQLKRGMNRMSKDFTTTGSEKFRILDGTTTEFS